MVVFPMDGSDNFLIKGSRKNGYSMWREKILSHTKHQDNSKCTKNMNVKNKVE